MNAPQTPASDLTRSLPSLVGSLLAGRYRVDALIGEGGMGAVYRGEHVLMHKPVAIKVLHPAMTLLEEARQRFEREAVAAGRIQHPHVVNATDFGRLDNGAYYLILDYVEGESLGQRLARSGPLPLPQALRIAVQIAEALEAAHRVRVVHRDLKPDNILLTSPQTEASAGATPGAPSGDFVKVLDFGIAKVDKQASSERSLPQLTRLGAVFGTPDYMSPEQAKGLPTDARADLYALGIVLYEMLTGTTPFAADDVMVVLTRHLTQDPPELPDQVPVRLRQIIARLLAKAPEDRIQTAHEVLLELRAVERPGSERSSLMRWSTRAAPRFSHLLRQPLTRKAPLSVWHAALGLLLLGGIGGALLLSWLGPGSAAEAVATEPAPASPVSATELARRAGSGDPEALSALSTLPAEQHTADSRLALGHALFAAQRAEEGLLAYQQALRLEPAAAEDPLLLTHLNKSVRQAALRAASVSLAQDQMGAIGADLLYHWQTEVAELPELQSTAKKALAGPARAHASAALNIALTLESTRACPALKKLLPRVAQDADARALPELKKRLGARGCGFLKLADCYACLRGDDALAQAIAAAGSRPAPIFPRDSAL